jgi:hypothetical protein
MPNPSGSSCVGINSPLQAHLVIGQDYRFHNLFYRSGIVTIASKNLITQREPLPAYYQGNVHLLTIGTVIPRITALGLRVFLGFAFEVGARHVVEQEIVFDLE